MKYSKKSFEEGQYSAYNEEIINLFSETDNFSSIAANLSQQYELNFDSFRKYVSSYIKYVYSDKEVIKENVRLAKQKQAFQDKNRIQNKAFRESSRIENAVESYNEKLIELLRKDGLKVKTSFHQVKKEDQEQEEKISILLHLSDLHLNELIDIPGNSYDFIEASKRLKKLAEETISLGAWKGVYELVLAFGGDLLNSDRRLDELLSMATNRAKATQISIRLLKMFILHLNTRFNITCVGVTGNESRAKQELGWTDIIATDSYDFTIYDSLGIIFENSEGVTFTMMEANEVVFSIYDRKVLLLHGHQLRKSSLQKQVQEIIGKYANRGIKIDFVVFGHIHSALLSDWFARNGSICGSNAYSQEALGFLGRASQNVHLFTPDSIHSTKIDLQNTSRTEAYPIENDLAAYNAQGSAMLRKKTKILEIVI